MFTGIITGTGTVQSVTKKGPGKTLKIVTNKNFLHQSKIGDSISIDGICTTITELNNDTFTCDYLNETLTVTTADTFTENTCLNLELAATLSSYFGGHMVSGHIDTTATILSLEKKEDWGKLCIECPKPDAKYLIYKGSITIDGISLTISKVEDSTITIELIPHTIEKTHLFKKSEGSLVNVEYDILGKYVANMLKNKDM